MKYYAQTNENGIVHTVCQLAEEISGGNIIEIQFMDESLKGKKYNTVTGEFEEN